MDLAFGATVSRFVQSRAFTRILMGPRGEGKTIGGFGALLAASMAVPPRRLPIRVIVVRDTWTNLMRSFKDAQKELVEMGLEWKWTEDDHEAIIGGGRLHLFFIGMDSGIDLNKFQGFGAGVLWIEEPAPAADMSGGVTAEVYGVGVTSLRQQGVPHFCIITMNPPDDDHWTLTLRTAGHHTVERFLVQRGENKTIKEIDRQRFEEALIQIGREDLRDRLILGKVGAVKLGQPVTPEYDEAIHVAQRPLPIIPGIVINRFWDFGLNPTCVWSQIVPSGRLHILGTRVGENIGIDQHIRVNVVPFEKQYLGDPQDWNYRDIGDPAGCEREQSDSERTAVLVLQEMLNTSFEPAPTPWPDRRDSLRAVLRNGRMLQIDPDENRDLKRALNGGWHYPKNPSGTVIDTVIACKRASGKHSHPGDALGYGTAVLFPLHDRWAMKRPQPKREEVASEFAWMAR